MARRTLVRDQIKLQSFARQNVSSAFSPCKLFGQCQVITKTPSGIDLHVHSNLTYEDDKGTEMVGGPCGRLECTMALSAWDYARVSRVARVSRRMQLVHWGLEHCWATSWPTSVQSGVRVRVSKKDIRIIHDGPWRAQQNRGMTRGMYDP